MTLQSSQRLPELLFYTKKSYSNSSSNTTRTHYREFSIQNPILHTEDRELFEYYNSTHRRQGDLLEMHPCVYMTFQLFQATPVAPETFRTFQSFMTFQPSRQFYNVPVSPGNPPHSSILRLECIFYIFYNSTVSTVRLVSRKLHRVPVGQLQTLQTFILQRKGDVAISVKMSRCQDDIFPRIELIPSFVLSSDNTNCKNDIQLFHQLFDELSVHTDYH